MYAPRVRYWNVVHFPFVTAWEAKTEKRRERVGGTRTKTESESPVFNRRQHQLSRKKQSSRRKCGGASHGDFVELLPPPDPPPIILTDLTLLDSSPYETLSFLPILPFPFILLARAHSITSPVLLLQCISFHFGLLYLLNWIFCMRMVFHGSWILFVCCAEWG